MRYSKVLLSILACSTLSYGADTEYQVNFSGSGNDYNQPTWTPPFASGTDFTWDQESGKLIFDSNSTNGGTPPTNPPVDVTATFQSSANDSGILTLKNFSFSNGYKNTSDSTITLPTSTSEVTFGSTLTIKNDDTTAFKGFTLGAYGGNTGTGVNLYAGTNVIIDGFTDTVMKGTIYLKSGSLLGETTSGTSTTSTTLYSNQATSLSVTSEKAYSSFTMGGTLYLDTTSNDKTQKKGVASFISKVEGDTTISGSMYLYDKAEASISSGNTLTISSSINVYAQGAKKITQDSLGNESITQEDLTEVKKTNLALNSVKIALSGSISVGSNASEMVTQTDSDTGITTITTSPTDIGAIAQITADITKKSKLNVNSTAPTGWSEATKAQFVGTGSFRVGKNSEVILRTINNGDSSTFDESDPYAITLSSITIEDQVKGNKVLNFDAQTHIVDTTKQTLPSVNVTLSKLGANSGKINLTGSISLGANANVLIQSYDGIDSSTSASFSLSTDSVLWLKGKMSGESLTNKGGITAKGGAFVLGNVYNAQNTETTKTTLTNSGSTTISNSFRTTTEPLPSRPSTNATSSATEEEATTRELDPSGVFLLAKDNIFDNQGTLTFDGGGNLTSATSRSDDISRSLSITNSSGSKGTIKANGANNSIISSGSLSLSSQNITIASKTLDDDSTQEGVLTLTSLSSLSSDYISIGSSTPNSGKDKVSISGGTLKITSQVAGVANYNLRLTNTTLDLSNLANLNNSINTQTPVQSELDGSAINGAFYNLRNLELGGNVEVLVKKEKSSFVNGVVSSNASEQEPSFRSDWASMQVQGSNRFVASEIGEGTFGFDNYGVLDLKSNATLSIEGDLYNNGSIVFSGDQFGLGTLSLSGNLILDMTNHQESGVTINPLIAINHTNFHSLTLYQAYLLVQTEGEVQYQVGSALISSDSSSSGEVSPRADESNAPSYSTLQSALKTEIEDYLNGQNAYEGNTNKLGVFLNGVALIGTNYIGFGVTRSEAISSLTIDKSDTGLIDQYLQVLSSSDGSISENKTNDMINALYASDPKAMQALNNALQVQNGLELGILKDMGSYNTQSLISTAQSIQEAMQTVTNLSKPVIEDFKKMQVVREIAVQNRMVRASNPFTAEAELEQLVQSMVGQRYASNEVASKKSDILSEGSNAEVLAPFLFDDRIAFKNNVWLSAITSSTKTSLDTSALYGMSAGYEHMPIPNVLFGFYAGYGYSNYKSDTLKNNAHILDLSIYTRLYYGGSEVDLTLSYIHGFNQANTQFDNSALNQDFSFQSHSFDFSAKYGYVIGTPIKGMFLKPQATFTLYGIGTPDLIGEGENPIELAKQSMDGILFGLGVEIRQYISPVSYIYVLPSFDYNMYKQDSTSNVSFLNAYNKMNYELPKQGHYIFSLYAGGEGYVSNNLAINVSAGYKGALDIEDHNLSISAGLKYKF
ncbi:autotransporter outer membrane beta-barrel domain-containing protein [Helicobacter brantae]|nr:autotransporter outer membrane beta-barrel domain-containing protein [Helicobacter brantae]